MNTEDRRRTVVVGIDGSEEALRAVRWAVPEAGVAEPPSASSPPSPGPTTAWSAGPARPDGLRRPPPRLRRERPDRRGRCGDGARPRPARRAGSRLGFPGGVLVEQSRGAELLVVGDRGRGGPPRHWRVPSRSASPPIRHAPSWWSAARRVTDDQPLPVVVGIDGTPLSEAAIAFAFQAASARRAPLVVVHTWDGSVIAELVDWQSAAVEAEEELAERLAGWGAKYPDVAVQRVVGRAAAARALLDQSTRAQLVVVGSRGHGEIAGLLLDSVSNALVHAAGCPVAIVRSGE